MDESKDVINKVISNLEGNYYQKDHLEELMQPLVDRIANLNKKIMFFQENPTSGIKVMINLQIYNNRICIYYHEYRY